MTEQTYGAVTHNNWNKLTADISGQVNCVPDGGVSFGPGFTIAWQRGPLSSGRNGAFLLEVLDACRQQLTFHQKSKFSCTENEAALEHLSAAITALEDRLTRRFSEGVLGTHTPDAKN